MTFENGRFCHGHWAQAADGTGFWSEECRYTPRKARVKPTEAEIAGYRALEQVRPLLQAILLNCYPLMELLTRFD